MQHPGYGRDHDQDLLCRLASERADQPQPTPSDPAMAPSVLAAYTPPTRRPGSSPGAGIEASASGKLAPHSMAAGSTTAAHRARSIEQPQRGTLDDVGRQSDERQIGDQDIRRRRTSPRRAAAGTSRAPRAAATNPPAEDRASRAADPEPEEEHGENQRKGVDGAAEEQRQQAGPHNLRRERGEPRERNRQ